MAARRFTVQLERVGKSAAMFRVAFDLKEAFGRARPPVEITIRGHGWRTTETRARRIAAAVARVRAGEPHR